MENTTKNHGLWSRDFVLFFMGVLVSDIGFVIYNFATSWYILDLTGSATYAGAYMATGSVIYFLLANFGAAIVDRMDKVRIMYMTDFVRGIVIIIAGMIILNSADKTIILMTLYTTAAILATVGSFFGPAAASMIKYIVHEQNFQKANAYIGLKQSAQNVLSMALAGYIYGLLGIAWIFILIGVGNIISGITELFIRTKTSEKSNEPLHLEGILRDIKEGWVYMSHQKGLMRIMVVNLLINFSGSLLISIGLPYLFNQIVKVGPTYLSNLNVVMAISSLIATWFVTREVQKDKLYPSMSKRMVLIAIPLILILLVINMLVQADASFMLFYVSLMGLFAIMTLGRVPIQIYLRTLIMKTVEKEMIARASVVLQLISMAMFPLASTLGGLIIDQYSISVFLLIVGASFILGLMVFFTDKHIKEL